MKPRFDSPVVSIAAGVAIGLLLGLIWAYVIAPVEWSDAAPSHMRSDLQADYLRMTIDSFTRTNDVTTAQRRWLELGTAGPLALQALEANPGNLTIVEIELFRATVIGPLGVSGEPVDEDGSSPVWLWVLCLGLLVVGLGFLLTYLFRRGPVADTSAAMHAQEATRQAERTDYLSMGESQPISQFMTTYMLGDDLFDDSFSIDSAAGEFLGECGVGIAETAGPGEPKRVNAFEVWLFDKNDIQTVTKVVMSESAFHDVTTHDRLSAKGDPVLAEIDRPVVLETAKLRLSARIVDLTYGDDPMLPENSYFNQVTIELAIWPK
ncbi:MAG TPA: hypothetical protein VMN57_10880 [Anaerolineales bacterium]|nr:hypothetical protein [Anaerolineales bacterium]